MGNAELYAHLQGEGVAHSHQLMIKLRISFLSVEKSAGSRRIGGTRVNRNSLTPPPHPFGPPPPGGGGSGGGGGGPPPPGGGGGGGGPPPPGGGGGGGGGGGHRRGGGAAPGGGGGGAGGHMAGGLSAEAQRRRGRENARAGQAAKGGHSHAPAATTASLKLSPYAEALRSPHLVPDE